MSKFGRYAVAEAPHTLAALHWHRGETLRTVDHEPNVAVLDQEDLFAQGIDTSVLIPGAPKVDALGSCTANAFTAALSTLVDAAAFTKATGAASFTDTKGAEEFAIRFYHGCTDQTGEPASEWPPTDCGSSGPYVVDYATRLGLVAGAQVAAPSAESICSLMQAGALIVGQPWFNSFMEPDANGFIDGVGGGPALERAIASGVAGGHETCWSAIEALHFDGLGRVDPGRTVIRFRNSWTATWADHGSGRLHLSTYLLMATHCDFRRLLPAD